MPSSTPSIPGPERHDETLFEDAATVQPAAAPSPAALSLTLLVLAAAAVSLNLRPIATSIGPVLEEIQSGLGVSSAVAGILTALPGLIFGLAQATGAATGYARNVATAINMGDLNLPRLRDGPDITVELIGSDAAPGGVSDLAVPPVAPAIANALASATGRRFRTLPLA